MSWRTLTIGDLVDAGAADIQTGPFGTQLKASDYVDEGTPVINVRNIGLGELEPEKLEFVSEETSERLASHLLEQRDIVFGRKGAVDRHLYVRDEQANWLQGSDCIRIRFLTNNVVPRFVSYSFLTDTHRKWMLAQSGNKATMASLNHDIIRRIALHLPAATVQRTIVDILTAYDDLIENNRRRVALLEEAARHLYHEWFVRLRFPGHEHTHIVNGVPEGWERKRLSDVADVNKESLPGSFDGEIDYVDISSVTPGSINETTRYDFKEAPSRARRVVKHGDIIWSCVRPNRKSYAVIWQPTSNLIVSTGFAVITPTALPTAYLLQATTTDAFVGYLENHARGAAYPAVVAGDFERARVFMARASLVGAFNEQAEPLLAQANTLRLQIQRLRAARDLLLPRLLSEEIAV
ncbi:MAG: restriction endonuclease subunit S [Gemmatimonadetes bacterium]|nr:MAG: restriction endonuclease subunit S [Gemmatimonadota bacterium]